MGPCLTVDGEVDHAQGAPQPQGVPGDVGHGQVGLHGVHGGVDTAVVLGVGEVGRVGLHGHAVGLVPPVPVDDLNDVTQQLGGPGAVRGGGGGGGQHDEGVLVALLAGQGIHRGGAPGGVHLVAHGGVPAPVVGVPHGRTQGAHAVVGVAAAAGDP